MALYANGPVLNLLGDETALCWFSNHQSASLIFRGVLSSSSLQTNSVLTSQSSKTEQPINRTHKKFKIPSQSSVLMFDNAALSAPTHSEIAYLVLGKATVWTARHFST